MAEPSFAFDGVVRLTKIGAAYLAFTVIAGFAAINTGNNSLYIGLTFMLGGLLLSGVASKGGLKHLEVEFVALEQAWAGRVSYGTIRVRNGSRIWNVRDVVVTSPEMAAPLLVAVLPRGEELILEASFLFQRRGLAKLKTVDLYTRYPFGFFLKKRRVRIEGEAVVYPHLLDEAAARERFIPVEGEQVSSNRPGPGADVHSFREYVRGDSLRQVHWRKSASSGRWIIKQSELESGRAVHIVVDPHLPNGLHDADFERMISEAATFVSFVLDRGMEVFFSVPGLHVRATAEEATQDIYRALALIQYERGAVAQAIEPGSIVFATGRDDVAKSA